MEFTKLEGLGNDYIYIDCLEEEPEDLPGLAVRLSDRHFGVGADGLICVKPGRGGDFAMEMYNADGSRGAMCGNGIRGLAKYVYDRGLTRKRCLTIDTDAGPRGLELRVKGGQVEAVTVDMGPARVGRKIGVEVNGRTLEAVPVELGNSHRVFFCKDPEKVPLERLGPVLEHHPALSPRSNIEFVCVPDRGHMILRVWERGSGLTLACGTGACAAFGAAGKLGLCGPVVTARLPGGELRLEASEGRIFMTGPARTVFHGSTEK